LDAGRAKLNMLELGVHAGATIRYLLTKRSELFKAYVAVDPYFMDGKPTLDGVLEFYHKNITDFCVNQNGGKLRSICSTVRMKSEDFFDACQQSYADRTKTIPVNNNLTEPRRFDEYYDVIFIDAEHTLKAVSAEMQCNYCPFARSFFPQF
jgi:hypothetical protein